MTRPDAFDRRLAAQRRGRRDDLEQDMCNGCGSKWLEQGRCLDCQKAVEEVRCAHGWLNCRCASK